MRHDLPQSPKICNNASSQQSPDANFSDCCPLRTTSAHASVSITPAGRGSRTLRAVHSHSVPRRLYQRGYRTRVVRCRHSNRLYVCPSQKCPTCRIIPNPKRYQVILSALRTPRVYANNNNTSAAQSSYGNCVNSYQKGARL